MAEKWVIIKITKQENSLNEVSISYLLFRICTQMEIKFAGLLLIEITS
jgi:hypothetical protein